jgi:hypothetical protein
MLEVLHSTTLESCRNSRSHSIRHRGRDKNATWLGQAFESGRNHQRLAEWLIFFEEHVTKMYSDAKAELHIGGRCQSVLGNKRTANGINGTFKQCENAIARHAKEPTSVGLEGLLGDPSHLPKVLERACLVGGHVAAKIRDVGSVNRSKAPAPHHRWRICDGLQSKDLPLLATSRSAQCLVLRSKRARISRSLVDSTQSERAAPDVERTARTIPNFQ